MIKWIASRLIGRTDWPDWYSWDLWRLDLNYRLHPTYEKPMTVEYERDDGPEEMTVMIETTAPIWKMPFIRLGWYI
jgi:hypothetical protein